MLKGWDDQVMFNLTIQKTMTKIISEVTNRSMGGKGVADYIDAMIPLGEKDKKVEMTPEKISYLIARHNENMKRNREERERKKGLNNE